MIYVIDTKKFNTLLKKNNLTQYQNLDDYLSSYNDDNRYMVVNMQSDRLAWVLSYYDDNLTACIKFDRFNDCFGIENNNDLQYMRIRHFNDPFIIKFDDIHISDSKAIDVTDVVIKLLKDCVVKECVTRTDLKVWVNRQFIDKIF